jgi:serine/threonine-protein kinase
MVGQKLWHYTIDSFLGAGGMGRVYSAHHTHLEHKRFAIKVLSGELAATVEMRVRFAQEADAASRLNHPNVVSVLDFGKSEHGLMFLVMELVEGRSIAELIARGGPMPLARALRLVRQICLGLQHAHSQGLVHRDLKPDNVLVDEADGARIVDFGLAIRADATTARLTQVGLALGTPVYAAPEQTHNEPVDHRADLFALGVTLYEMLAGRPPFDGGTVELIHHNATTIPPEIAVRSGVVVPTEVDALIRRLMQRDPDARYGTASEVVEAIDAIVLAPTRAVSLPLQPRFPVRRAWLAIGGIATTVAVAAVVALVATHPQPQTAKAPLTTSRAPRAEPTPDVPALEVSSSLVTPSPPPDAAPASIPRPDAAPASKARGPRGHPNKKLASARMPAPVEASPAELSATPSSNQPVAVEPPTMSTPIEVPRAPLPPATTLPSQPPLWTTADAKFESLRVSGALTDADVRRALARIEPTLRSCYQAAARADHKSPRATLAISFSIGNTRRASEVQAVGVWSPLARCVGAAIGQLRTETAPDVGDASVTLNLGFQPVAP